MAPTAVNTLELHANGYSRTSWWLHTHKANFVFIIMLVIIAVVSFTIEDMIRTDQCATDKTTAGILFGLDVMLAWIIYQGIWPHTQFRKLPPTSSKFLGCSAIIHQQNQLLPQAFVQTPIIAPQPVAQVSPVVPATLEQKNESPWWHMV